jgi:4'-phosphopantetheinyl transferase
VFVFPPRIAKLAAMPPLWSAAPPLADLAEGEIAVWKTLLDQGADEIEKLETKLSQDEKDRASRFHFSRDRERFVLARGTLRKLIGGYLKLPPEEVRFRYGPQGKPALDMNSPLHFNLSHSQNMALFAFALERRIGIDIERIQRDFNAADIAARYFSDAERLELRSLPPELHAEAFFLCWTRKEAFLKACGTGLNTPLNGFSVHLTPCQPAGFGAGIGPGWQIESFYACDDYPAAVVYDGQPGKFNFFAIQADSSQRAIPML